MTVLSIDVTHIWWCPGCGEAWWEDGSLPHLNDHDCCAQNERNSTGFNAYKVLRLSRSDGVAQTLDCVVGIPAGPRGPDPTTRSTP